MLAPYCLNQLEQEADFTIDCSVRCEKLFDLEWWNQIEQLRQHVKNILHECVVILSNQIILSRVLNELCNLGRID